MEDTLTSDNKRSNGQQLTGVSEGLGPSEGSYQCERGYYPHVLLCVRSPGRDKIK